MVHLVRYICLLFLFFYIFRILSRNIKQAHDLSPTAENLARFLGAAVSLLLLLLLLVIALCAPC